jgi:hypothetical protein
VKYHPSWAKDATEALYLYNKNPVIDAFPRSELVERNVFAGTFPTGKFHPEDIVYQRDWLDKPRRAAVALQNSSTGRWP